MILGMTWLNKHNPEIDFRAGTVKMTRCLPQCCVACQTERRDERKAEKKFAQQVNTCRTGPFPVFIEDADDEDDELYMTPETLLTHHPMPPSTLTFLMNHLKKAIVSGQQVSSHKQNTFAQPLPSPLAMPVGGFQAKLSASG